jgi:hypothetical protein
VRLAAGNRPQKVGQLRVVAIRNGEALDVIEPVPSTPPLAAASSRQEAPLGRHSMERGFKGPMVRSRPRSTGDVGGWKSGVLNIVDDGGPGLSRTFIALMLRPPAGLASIRHYLPVSTSPTPASLCRAAFARRCGPLQRCRKPIPPPTPRPGAVERWLAARRAPLWVRRVSFSPAALRLKSDSWEADRNG